jgi:hypothetical protein
MRRRALSTGEKIGAAVAGFLGAGMVVALVLGLSNPGDVSPRGRQSHEDDGPIRPGVCVTGLPPGATAESTRSYGVSRVSCRDPAAQLWIMHEAGPEHHVACREWLITIGVEEFCARELHPSTAPT